MGAQRLAAAAMLAVSAGLIAASASAQERTVARTERMRVPVEGFTGKEGIVHTADPAPGRDGDGGRGAAAPDPVARDKASAAGLDYHGGTQGHVVTFDFDRDGDYDVILSKHGNQDWPIMWRNADATFTQVYANTLRDADDTDDDDKHGCIDGDFGKSTGDKLPDGLVDISGGRRSLCRGGLQGPRRQPQVRPALRQGQPASLPACRGRLQCRHGSGLERG